MARITLKTLAQSCFPAPNAEADFALREMDHVWADGGAYALLGSSGYGKTTLLTIIAGLVLMALPALVPFNLAGTIWQIFGRVDIGLPGHTLAALGVDYTYTNDAFDAWATVIVMGVWHLTSLVALLCHAGLQSIPEADSQAAKINQASRLSVFR